MSDEQKSINETKELLIGVMALATLLVTKFKNGVKVQTIAEVIAAIQSDAELQAKLLAAYNDVDQVPHETKDLSVEEVVELISVAAAELPALIKAIRA